MIDVANNIIRATQAITPIRHDYKKMHEAMIEIPREIQQFFGGCANQIKRDHSISSSSTGLFSYRDIQHLAIVWFEEKMLVDIFQMANCDAFCCYVPAYCIENNIDVPITFLNFVNYNHTIIALGINMSEKELLLRGEININDKIFQDVLFLDLWKKRKPIMRANELHTNMTELFSFEQGLCPNPTAIGKSGEFNVKIQTHIARPCELYSFYRSNQENFKRNKQAILSSYQRRFPDRNLTNETLAQTNPTAAIVETNQPYCSFFAKAAVICGVGAAAVYLVSNELSF